MTGASRAQQAPVAGGRCRAPTAARSRIVTVRLRESRNAYGDSVDRPVLALWSRSMVRRTSRLLRRSGHSSVHADVAPTRQSPTRSISSQRGFARVAEGRREVLQSRRDRASALVP